MHYNKEAFNDFVVTNFDYNKSQSCLTFSIEGQMFGLLLASDAKIVNNQEQNINVSFNIDLRKVLDMPTTKRPVESWVVLENYFVF